MTIREYAWASFVLSAFTYVQKKWNQLNYDVDKSTIMYTSAHPPCTSSKLHQVVFTQSKKRYQKIPNRKSPEHFPSPHLVSSWMNDGAKWTFLALTSWSSIVYFIFLNRKASPRKGKAEFNPSSVTQKAEGSKKKSQGVKTGARRIFGVQDGKEKKETNNPRKTLPHLSLSI